MYAESAKIDGCDTFITGETEHSAYHLAREAKINLIFGGHYATETVGLKALSKHIEKQLELPGKFVSAPTGY